MSIDTIKQLFNEKKEVHFKLFSLEYTIINNNDKVCVYADLYPKIKKEYNSIDDALNNYTVYNESIIESQDRISDVK